MMRNFLAVFLAFTIIFIGFTKPAYASSVNFDFRSISSVSQSSNFQDTFSPLSDSNPKSKIILRFMEKMIGDAAKDITGYAVICYTADGLATTVFPPAAAIAPFCPALGTSAIGAKLIKTLVHAR